MPLAIFMLSQGAGMLCAAPLPPPCHHICTLGWKPPLEVIGQPSYEVELDNLAQIVILYNFGFMCEQPFCAIST